MNQDMQTRKRLELMRLIREENRSNQQRIRTREEILYGRSSSYLNALYQDGVLTAAEEGDGYRTSALPVHPGQEGETNLPASSFSLRFLVAALLFGVYFYSKTQDVSVGGIDAVQIEEAVSRDNPRLTAFLDRLMPGKE